MNNKRVVSIYLTIRHVTFENDTVSNNKKKNTQKCWIVNTNNRPALKF